MYRFFFNACLVTLGIGTAIGVSAVWLPEECYVVAGKLAWTNGILFVSSIVGALLCKLGDA